MAALQDKGKTVDETRRKGTHQNVNADLPGYRERWRRLPFVGRRLVAQAVPVSPCSCLHEENLLQETVPPTTLRLTSASPPRASPSSPNGSALRGDRDGDGTRSHDLGPGAAGGSADRAPTPGRALGTQAHPVPTCPSMRAGHRASDWRAHTADPYPLGSAGPCPTTRCHSVGFILRLLSLTCRWPLSPCVLTWPCWSVCVCVLLSSSYEDASHLGSGPTLMASFQLNAPLKPRLQIQPHSEVPGARTSTYEFAKDTVQSTTLPSWVCGRVGRLRTRHVTHNSDKCHQGRSPVKTEMVGTDPDWGLGVSGDASVGKSLVSWD